MIHVYWFLGSIIISVGINYLLFGNNKVVTEEKREEEKEEKEEKKVVYQRRGICEKSYTNIDDNKRTSFLAQYELGEIESTRTKSKVVVISVVTNKSEFNNNKHVIANITGMVNNTWMLSSEIEWIENKAKERNDKIDNILID